MQAAVACVEMADHRYRAELHLHSCWSLLDGASSTDELILRARELGYESLALTDHDGLYGSMEFAQAAKSFGIRPITGAEVTLEDGHHLTLLAADVEGYGNLCRLLSTAHLTSTRKEPHLSLDALAQHTRGLIALSGCKHGEVPALLDAGDYPAAEAWPRRRAQPCRNRGRAHLARGRSQS